MSYALGNLENVREGVSRCAAEQLDRAVRELSERTADDPVEAVHAARKAIKKARSVLRLARGSMPRRERRRANRMLRRTAGELGQARDAEAVVDTLDGLAERYAGQLPRRAFEDLKGDLEAVRDHRRGELLGSALNDGAAGELSAVSVRVWEWRLGAGGWEALEAGLRRSYADGRRAQARARSHGSVDDWHTWRKRVKDLWYHERLLADVGGPAVKGQAKDAHRLADLLGDEHDLAVLRHALRGGHGKSTVHLEEVLALIERRREELRTEALYLGQRVYAEKPGAFIRRMRRSWNAGRGQARSRVTT